MTTFYIVDCIYWPIRRRVLTPIDHLDVIDCYQLVILSDSTQIVVKWRFDKMNYSSFTFLCINESMLDDAMQMMQPDAMMRFIDDGNASSCDVNSTTSSFGDLPHHRIKLYHLHLGTQLVKYIFPFILVFGTIGNALSMIVLRRKAMRTSCSSAYLYSLSIADMTVLYLSGFKTWLRVSTGFELLHAADAICRLVKYGFYTATHLSALLIVIVTIERLLVVYCPIRAADFWIVRRPHLTTWLAAIAVMAVDANIIWASELVMIAPGKWLCATYDSHDVMCDVIPTVNLFVYSVIPSIIVFSCNIVIIYVTVRAGVTTPRSLTWPVSAAMGVSDSKDVGVDATTASVVWPSPCWPCRHSGWFSACRIRS